MTTFTITCALTDAEVDAVTAMASEIGVTPAQFFQRFWDGYTVDTKPVVGSVRAQVSQYIADRLKNTIADSNPADVLAALSK